MAEKTIHIPYGKGEATLTLPQERIGSILVPRHHAALSIDDAVTACLRHPTASPPLREMVKKRSLRSHCNGGYYPCLEPFTGFHAAPDQRTQ